MNNNEIIISNKLKMVKMYLYEYSKREDNNFVFDKWNQERIKYLCDKIYENMTTQLNNLDIVLTESIFICNDMSVVSLYEKCKKIYNKKIKNNNIKENLTEKFLNEETQINELQIEKQVSKILREGFINFILFSGNNQLDKLHENNDIINLLDNLSYTLI